MDSKEEIFKYRLIAFVDILAFKELINSEKHNKLIGIIKKFQENASEPTFFEKFVRNDDGLEITEQKRNEAEDAIELQNQQIAVFSDLIVMSYSGAKQYFDWSFKELISKMHNLIWELRSADILVRGGITYGPLYHDGPLCLGPALIRAYELEDKEADYPRIIIDPKLLRFKLFNRLVAKIGTIESFEDGYIGLGYTAIFNGMEEEMGRGYEKEDGEPSPKFHLHYELHNLYRTIINNQNLYWKNPKPKAAYKLNWLGKQYNALLDRFLAVGNFQDGGMPKIDYVKLIDVEASV